MRKVFSKAMMIIGLITFLVAPEMVVYGNYSVRDSANLSADSGYWSTWNDVNALFGSVKTTIDEGATLHWDFTGDRIAYLYSTAYNRGSVKVIIDNIPVDVIDLYTPQTRRQVGKVYKLANSGSHTIKIVNRAAASFNRRYIDVDAFVSDIVAFPQGIYEENATYVENGVTYYPLGFFGNGWYTTNGARITSSAGSGFRVNFNGDYIRWYFPNRSDLSDVAVSIDGDDAGILNIDGQTSILWSGLGPGPHIMTAINLATNGSVLSFDKADIGTQTSYRRVQAAQYADAWAHGKNNFWYGYFATNDCANFTSQVQNEGGLLMHPAEPYANIYDTSHWFNYFPTTPSLISYSWRTVPDFRTYIYQPGRIEYIKQMNNPGYMRKGDIQIIDQDGDLEYDHTKAIVGYGRISGYSEDYTNLNSGWSDLSLQDPATRPVELITSAHTTDRWHVPACFNYYCGFNTIYVIIQFVP